MIKTGIIDPALSLRIVRDSIDLAFDTETTGLEVTDKVCGWVITNWEVSIYTPVRHEAGGNIPNAEEYERELAAAFADRSRKGLRTVGHHLGFDLRSSLRHGVVIRGPVEDTMINESLIDDTTRGYGLDDTAARRGVTAKKGDRLYAAIAARFGGLPDRSSMKNFWRMPGDDFEVLDYATGDGVSTIEVWRAQQELLDKYDVRVPWKLECDLMPYLARMHHRGIRIDSKYGEQAVKNVGKQLEVAKAKFSPGFNVRSAAEVEALYRANGYTDDMFTRTEPTKTKPDGQISFREKWLELNDIGKDILAVRRLEKGVDSFITPLLKTHNVNGRVHPVLHQSKSDEYGVAGARLSCSEPNLQAYPKRNKVVGALVRPLVIPDDGMLIEEADAMQQEPRFFTHYSEDQALIDGYRSGTMDIHDRAAEQLHLERDYAKRLGLGMLTMMSPPTLAMHMNYSLAEARRDHRAFLEDAFPAIRQFQQTAMRVFKNRGFVKSILGRRAWCTDPRYAYQAISRIIQNSGGDHMKTVLLILNQYEDAFPDVFQVLLSIHDSGIWQRDPGHDPHEVIRQIEAVAEQFGLLVPIPFELGSGDNWAEASYTSKIPGNGKELKGKHGWLI